MSANVTIAPLPEAEEDTQLGNSPFVYGYYGLEGCSVRGIVRVSLPPSQPQIHVISLSVSLLGSSRLSYSSEGGDSHSVKKILVKETVDLLDDITLSDDIDFPFTIDLPDPMHRQPTMAPIVQSAVRSANLLPPSMLCKGVSVHSYPFEAAVLYELVAELVLSNTQSFPLSFIMAPSTPITARVNVSPFIVHDPRQLPSIMLSDSKRWRSAPGDSPLEYELELGATTIGPGDTFSFLYRLAVARDAAAKGVKVKKVSLLLREHRTLGTTMHSLVPAAYKCVRSSNEIKRWEFEDTEPPGFEDLMMDETADGDTFDKDDFAFEIEGDGDLRSYAEDPPHQSSAYNEASSNSDATFSKSESMDLLSNEKPQTGTNIESNAALSHEMHPSRPTTSSSQGGFQSYHSQQLSTNFGISSPRLNGRKIKYQTRQTHKKKPSTSSSTASPSRANQKNSAKNAGNNVEMSELRPRRKLADGMTFYNASHLQSTNASTYDQHLQPSSRGGRFSDGWSGGPGGDGLYVEHEARITMPKLSHITPSSFKPGDPNLAFPNPHNHIYTSVPYIDIKHTLQVRIELHGVEKPIVHECWAVVTSVGKRECEAVLENRCELMPTLDYEKVFGTGVWVPAYEEVDPFLGDAGGSGFSSSVEAEEQFEVEDDLARFFGPWKTLVQRPPRTDDSRPTSWDPSKGGPSNIGFMEPDALAPGYRSRSMSLAPVIPSQTPFNESNYFQKRPSISSILSFTSFNLPASGPTSPNHSELGSDDNYQQEDDEHQEEDSNLDPESANLSDFDTLPTPTTSNPLQIPPAATKRKKQAAKKRTLPPAVSTIPTMAAKSNRDRPNPPPPPPRLMSAHSLIAFDAVRVAALQDPLNEQLLREIQAYKRNSHYPQTRLDQSSNGSFGEEDEEKDDDDDADSDITGIAIGEGINDNSDQQNRDTGYLRHPLLGDEEIEARRRVKAVRKMIKKQNSGTGHSNGESSRASAVGNDLPPGYTSA